MKRPVVWSAIEGGARRLAGAHDDTRGVVVHTTGPALERWTLHPRATTVEHQIVDDTPLTFPNRNPGGCTVRSATCGPVSARGVHRHDLVTGSAPATPFGPHRQPGRVPVRHRSRHEPEARTAAGSSASSTTAPDAAPTSSSSTPTPSTARPSPPSTSHGASPTAPTPHGSPPTTERRRPCTRPSSRGSEGERLMRTRPP